jgi:hypothetical protein
MEEKRSTQPSRPAFDYPFTPIDPETTSTLSMSTKEVSQVSAIYDFLTAEVPFPDDDELIESSMDKLLNSLLHKNLRPLTFVCESLNCVPAKTTRLYKPDYAKALVQWRRQMPLSAPLDDQSTYGRADVLERIREVIREATMPSWFGSIPSNFGDTSAGTIKADEWRSLITVYIPIALISLWGSPSSDAKLRAVLDHTMDLVSAVYLSCARTMTTERATAYRSYITNYVGNLKRIHPKFNLRPNHHASFHIYDYLILFGPVHSWWSFPFERLIGILQRLPSNHKSGELETTMLHSYLKGSKLRTWLTRPDCPPAIKECKVLLDQVYGVYDDRYGIIDPVEDNPQAPDTARTTNVPQDLPDCPPTSVIRKSCFILVVTGHCQQCQVSSSTSLRLMEQWCLLCRSGVCYAGHITWPMYLHRIHTFRQSSIKPSSQIRWSRSGFRG